MAKQINTETTVKTNKVIKKDYVYAVGRRREAIARVRLYPDVKSEIEWGEQKVKKGEIFVNQKPVDTYFTSPDAKAMYIEPFRVTNTINKFAATVKVIGGGLHGQLEAAIHAISRALSQYDTEKFRPILKKRGFLTRDARVRERRKVGTGGKARRAKQSPKR